MKEYVRNMKEHTSLIKLREKAKEGVGIQKNRREKRKEKENQRKEVLV